MTEHINGYALALFALAQEEKKTKQYKEQATLMMQALEENEEYITLLDNKSLTADARKDLVKKAFGKKINKNLLNFMNVLVDRAKARVAVPALRKLIKLINEKDNVNEGVVYSATALTPAQLKKVETKTSKDLGKKVVLINKIDKELIAGVRVIVEDDVIEDTVSSRLEQIKNQLLEREDN